MEPGLATQEHPDFVVEWQIAEEPDQLIDLAVDRVEGQVHLVQEHRFAL